ncbi:MAG: Mu transposase C-terminal domain-containing protein [Pseudomonadota bacterium]|uniref:Mu transposase C-terminal domain-containing protein n=1 Tax=unclassified Phenylobacterium TaxID=2640670 RepID=UPI000AF96EC3|nr:MULTISPECIES: Mu transposase C-terminal domain-containing protein [unclassified Phenylobacterium]
MQRRSDYESKIAHPGPGAPLDIRFLDEERTREAERRCKIIEDLEAGGRFDGATVRAAADEFGASKSQFNRYRRKYRELKTLTCLLPQGSNGGRGAVRLHPEVEALIVEVREEFDRDKPNAPDNHAFAEIRRRARARNLPEPAHNTLRSRFIGVPIRQRKERKYGKKIAREHHNALVGATPKTDFPLQRIQIDHTLVDVVCTGVHDRSHIGRPWITVALDEHTRAVLAFVLSWEYPNAATVALLITRIMTPKEEWLKRLGSSASWPMHGKPEAIYVDNANEFSSEAVIFGCREWQIPKPETRPPGMPHFGGMIERFIGTAMGEMKLLKGSTAHARGFGKERTRNPNETAEMSLPELELWMIEAICEQYHRKKHSGNDGQRPDYAWARGIYGTERRPGRGEPEKIADKLKLFLDFAPIEYRTVQRYGVLWDVPYWGDVLQPYLDAGDKRRFVIRRNPYDLTRAWFRRPEDGLYYELRTNEITTENVALWEWQQERRKRRAAGDSTDVASIDASVQRQRDLEKDARNKTAAHRRRLNAERRAKGAEVTREILGDVTSRPHAPAPPAKPYNRDIFFMVDDETLI